MRSLASTSLADVVGRWLTCSLLALAVLLPISGCQKRDQVTKYTVKKLPPAKRAALAETKPPKAQPSNENLPASRMLAALVPHGKAAWFFKVTGPKEAVSEQMEKFLGLIRSLKFGDGEEAKPEWTLPEGWTAGEGNQFRFATLKAESADETLEIAVSVLPAADPTEIEYVLANVNRWCEQLGVPTKTKESLFAEDQPKNAEVRQFNAAGTKVTLVNLVGRSKGGGMGSAPFASSPNREKTKPASKPAPREPSPDNAGIPKWTVPDGWKESVGNQFSIAAFEVADGERSVRTTVSKAGGDLLANINRWRGQLGLPAWSNAELAKSVQIVSVDGAEATLLDLTGKDGKTGQPSSLLGAIVPHDGGSWFFKLTGDVELAKREKANFEAFVKSVKFN